MLELLVASFCIGNFRCDQATKAYLSYNKNPQIWADREFNILRKDATEVIGEQTLIGITTLTAATTQKNYQIRISKYFSIGRFEYDYQGKSSQGTQLVFGVTF